MDSLAVLEETIRSRRSVKEFLPQPVPRELIERLLEAAVWAPNHRLTEPWRFYVLTGAALGRLGEIARQVMITLGPKDGGDPAIQARKAAEAGATWANLPCVVFITRRADANPEVDQENYGAACCAVQNLMLAAHAAGLATSWSSGAVAAAPALHDFVGADADERMVGLIRIGFPATNGAGRVSRRTSASQYTLWVDNG